MLVLGHPSRMMKSRSPNKGEPESAFPHYSGLLTVLTVIYGVDYRPQIYNNKVCSRHPGKDMIPKTWRSHVIYNIHCEACNAS